MSAAPAESVEPTGSRSKTYPAVRKKLNVYTGLTRDEQGYTKRTCIIKAVDWKSG